VSKRWPKRRRPNAKGRSEGPSRHVRLHLWLLKSAAYCSLSVGARALLVEFYALYYGLNNGELFLSVREAARRLGCSSNFAAKCIAELCDRGFVRPHRLGGFNMKSEARRGTATCWVLTEFPLGNALATKDFMRWTPAPNSQPKNIRRSHQEIQSVSPGDTPTREINGSVSPQGTLSSKTDVRRSHVEIHR
jgi:hypothetical protein